jgi:hypothetical protein
MRRFFDEDYPYLVPGVSRHATNHIVDADDEGVGVRYHNLLMRYASPAIAPHLLSGGVLDNDSGLPGLWIYSPMLDRLRRTPNGWRIAERYVGGSMTNRALGVVEPSVAAMAPFMPHPEAWP